MKLVFLNVWHGELHDELRAFIRAQRRDTDVFCFQEADGEKLEPLFEELLSSYQKLTSYKRVTEACHCANAVFVSPQFLIADSGTLLDEVTDCGQGLFVELRTSKKAFYVCDVQGHARPGDKLDTPGRLAQSQGLIEYFKAKSAPAIMGGDFNLMPETQSVGKFEEAGYQNLIKDYTIPDDEVSDHQPTTVECSIARSHPAKRVALQGETLQEGWGEFFLTNFA